MNDVSNRNKIDCGKWKKIECIEIGNRLGISISLNFFLPYRYCLDYHFCLNDGGKPAT